MTSSPLSNTWYQELPLVTCWMNSSRRFSSTRVCSLLWFTRNRLPIVTDFLCHMPVTLSIISFNLFQYVTVDGCGVNWIKLNKGWSLSSNIPVAEHVVISWTPYYVLCVWCFNGNINYSQYFWSSTRYSLTS